MGDKEMQTSHELRQTEQSAKVSAQPHTVKCQAEAHGIRKKKIFITSEFT